MAKQVVLYFLLIMQVHIACFTDELKGFIQEVKESRKKGLVKDMH